MKKIALLAALSVVFGASGAFAVCNCPSPNPYAYDLSRVSVVKPIAIAPQILRNPCYNPCCDGNNVKKKSFFSRVFDGTRTVYQNTFGNFFTSMTGY